VLGARRTLSDELARFKRRIGQISAKCGFSGSSGAGPHLPRGPLLAELAAGLAKERRELGEGVESRPRGGCSGGRDPNARLRACAFRQDALRSSTVVRWTIVRGPREYKPIADAAVGWAYDLQRDEIERRRVSVEVAGTLAAASKDGVPDEVRRALRTKGRSAVESVLDRDEPPLRLLLTTAGIREQKDQRDLLA